MTTSRSHSNTPKPASPYSVSPSALPATSARPDATTGARPEPFGFTSSLPTLSEYPPSPHLHSPEQTSMGQTIPREEPAEIMHPRPSTSSSDSQGGLADTEMETEESSAQTSQRSPQQQQPPPKKKRTRTLTTPHQSAVLYALLAQSRFPSTATREEVGRSIGLSARKVQIWFQNQRQKARRPHSQSTAQSSSLQPPQYGAYPSPVEYPFPDNRSGQRSFDSSSEQYAPASGDERSFRPGPSGSTPVHERDIRLSGPGIPGYTRRRSFVQDHEVGESSRQYLPISSPRGRPYPDPREPRTYSRSPPPSPLYHRQPIQNVLSRPTTGEVRPGRVGSDRTLPPLRFPPPSPSQHLHMNSFASSSSYMSPTEPIFAHQPPEPVRQPSIPPPFALQPVPQYYTPSYASTFYPRPQSSSWEGRSSFSPRMDTFSSSPSHQHTRGSSDVREPMAQRPQSARQGRYDPVRGVVVPYSETSPASLHIHTPSRSAERNFDRREPSTPADN